MEGTGKMLVIAVGSNSQAGIIKNLIISGKFSTIVAKKETDETVDEEAR
jgi:hypothetical protein